MNKDRGIIKWLPFESLVSSKQVIDSILHEKNKIKKPILSLEQQQEISEKLILIMILKFYLVKLLI